MSSQKYVLSHNKDFTLCYVTNSCIPSYSANSIQIMRMSEHMNIVFSKFVLVIPKVYPNMLKFLFKNPNIFNFYGIRSSFNIKKINLELNYLWFKIDLFQNRAFAYLKRIHNPVIYTRSPSIYIKSIKNNYPTVLELHEFDLYKAQGQFKSLKVLQSNRNSLGLVAISSSLKQLYSDEGFYERKIIVSHDGVSPEVLKIGNEKLPNILKKIQRKPILMYTGKIEHNRGISILIQIAKHVDNVNVICLGGKKNAVIKWTSVARREGATNIFFFPAVPPSDIPKYLKVADILIAPYTDRVRSYKFMSPLKLFEYMATGTPIITTALQPIKEILVNKKTALLISPQDTKGYISAVLELLQNKALGEEIGTRAQGEVKKYYWQRRADNIHTFILNQLKR